MIVDMKHLLTLPLLLFPLAMPSTRLADDPPPAAKLRYVCLVVPDLDEALRYYTETIGFAKVEDQSFGKGQRWLVVAPKGQTDLGIVLYDNGAKRLDDAAFQKRIGSSTNWVLHVADCRGLFETLSKRGVEFEGKPVDLPWGTQAVFHDRYGNSWVLVEPRGGATKPSSAPAKPANAQRK
ncbi:MAG TPA: VOC family protein [Planctomycetota bacterium]|nr:VOC family protein [Planctomycetota bacterium]